MARGTRNEPGKKSESSPPPAMPPAAMLGLSRFEQRAFIKVQVLLDFGAADIHRQLVRAVGLGGALPIRTVQRSVHCFREGREETGDHPRPGSPAEDPCRSAFGFGIRAAWPGGVMVMFFYPGSFIFHAISTYVAEKH